MRIYHQLAITRDGDVAIGAPSKGFKVGGVTNRLESGSCGA